LVVVEGRDEQGQSRWNTHNLTVGDLGNGTLQILNGGYVSTGTEVVIGNSGGPGATTGAVTVDGWGSKLAVSDGFGNSTLTVGNAGDGSLSISSGGQVLVDGTLHIGEEGVVDVSGGTTIDAESHLIVSEQTDIQPNGSTFTVHGGASVETGDTGIGENSTGRITSRSWETNDFRVEGTLQIDGGLVTSLGDGTVASDGRVEIVQNASWGIDGGLNVGNESDDDASIAVEGHLRSGDAEIGTGASRMGQVTISGFGSWKAGQIDIGYGVGLPPSLDNPTARVTLEGGDSTLLIDADQEVVVWSSGVLTG
jgi:T5SS/PEP-CTERM-associated repeat protein